MKEQKRLRILGDDEIEDIYGRPRFTPEERIQYFSLSQAEKELLTELRSVKSQAYFVLQLGYFKAKRLFFTFDLDEVEEDMQFVLSQHFNNRKITNLSAVDKHTRLKQQRLILKLFDYRSCDAETRQKLAAKAQQSASVCSKPIYIFRELMHYLSEQNIVAPGYSFMQDTIGQALTYEQKRLTSIVGNHLTSSDIEALRSLLNNSEGLYEITQLKREAKDFSLSEIKREINRGDQIRLLYHLAQRVLPELKVSNESIKYYASLVTYYSVFRLKQLDEQMVYVYLLCFIYYRYQSFEDDLIDDKQWQKKEELITITGLTILSQPMHEHLALLEQRLEERIIAVNQRITAGLNEHLQVKKRGKSSRWTLQYPRSSDPVNHPFFDRLRQVDIGDVLHFVNQQCQFMEAFKHILGRYVKQESDDRVLTACLVAWATNTGLSKMGEISDIGYHTLAAISDSFIRLETLQEANDCISNAIAGLAIFQYYNLGETIHSSSDGQKFETQRHTINARYSPKYFGLKKGIVSYTLVANHIPANVKIISANDHESHHVFDILFNNTTDIQRGAIRQLCGRKPSARLKFTPPIPTAQMRSILLFCTCSDISSPRAIRISMIKSANPSMASSTRVSMRTC